MKTTIKAISPSQYKGSNSMLLIFEDMKGNESHCVVNDKVMKFVDTYVFDVGDEILVSRTYSHKQDKMIWVLKKVIKK